MNWLKRHYNKFLANARGGAELVTVVFMTSALAVATLVTLNLVGAAMTSTGQFILNKKALYAAEGGIRLVQKLAQTYLGANPCTGTTQADLQTCSTHLVNNMQTLIQNIQLGSFQFNLLQTNVLAANTNQQITSGPFVGMAAQLSTVNFGLTASTESGSVASTVYQTSQIGTIKLFQFFVFLNTYINWDPGPVQNVSGHVHSNTDICLGGQSQLNLTQVTSAGHIYNLGNGNCRASYTPATTYISNNGVLGAAPGPTMPKLVNGGDSGCTNCAGSGQSWVNYATSTWNGYVQDTWMGVPVLLLPGMASTVPAQEGFDTAQNPYSNNGSLRILIDPVLPTDTALVKETKLSYLSDIRIINGVWYLKDINNNSDWPGIPIWSDHPGAFTPANEGGIETTNPVGQSDLASSLSWTSTPQNYSYYSYNTGTNALNTGTQGVISYGNLYRAGGPVWRPGFWSPGTNNYLCKDTTQACSSCSTTGTLTNNGGSTTNTYGIMDAAVAMTCHGGVNPDVTMDPSTGFLNATRGGFMNGHVYENGGGQEALQLPENFDVGQFLNALNNTNSGELGTYFQPGGLIGRPFNGIIFIANTWSGSLNGTDGSTTATNWPQQGFGQQNDASQPTAYAQPNGLQTIQGALPYELCSSTPGLIGQPYDGASGVFTVPDCSKYPAGTGPIQARPAQLRIFNGSTLTAASPNPIPQGLSIVTNLPAYMMGDFNSSSTVTSPTSTPWVPTMIASDFISKISNNWDDLNSPWNNSNQYYLRTAATTNYVTALLFGYITEATNGAGGADAADLNNSTRYNEDWTGIPDNLWGSMVVGSTSVYFHYRNNSNFQTYEPPNRNWTFDPHLSNTTSQPPGTPSFYVYSVQNWYQ